MCVCVHFVYSYAALFIWVQFSKQMQSWLMLLLLPNRINSYSRTCIIAELTLCVYNIIIPYINSIY